MGKTHLAVALGLRACCALGKEKRKAGLLTRSEPYTAPESAVAPEQPPT